MEPVWHGYSSGKKSKLRSARSRGPNSSNVLAALSHIPVEQTRGHSLLARVWHIPTPLRASIDEVCIIFWHSTSRAQDFAETRPSSSKAARVCIQQVARVPRRPVWGGHTEACEGGHAAQQHLYALWRVVRIPGVRLDKVAKVAAETMCVKVCSVKQSAPLLTTLGPYSAKA